MSRSAAQVNEDEIQFSLVDVVNITNDTVKVRADVSAMIDGTKITNENVADRVRALLTSFVSSEWSFSNPTRSTITGVEQASYVAYTRITADQNFDLEKRSQDAGERGIKITAIETDTSVPANKVREAATNLRTSLLKQATDEAAILSETAGRTYRVANIVYGQMNDPYANISRAKSFAASSTYALDASESGAIGNTQKFSMTATVILSTISKVPQIGELTMVS